MANRIKYIRTDTLPKTPIGADVEGLDSVVRVDYSGEWVDGSFITSTNGQLVSSSVGYSYYEVPVLFTSETVVRIKTLYNANQMPSPGIAWYDVNGVYINGYAFPSASSTSLEIELNLPSTVRLIRITCATEWKDNFSISFENQSVFEDLIFETEKLDLLGYDKYENIEYEQGMRIGGKNGIKSRGQSNLSKVSEYLEVPAEADFVLTGIGDRSSLRTLGWAFYDENLVCLKYGAYDDQDSDYQRFSSPTGARYFAFTAADSRSYIAHPRLYFKLPSAAVSVSKQAFTGKYIGAEVLASTAICVGDSVTYGYRFTDPEKTYPYALGRITGWTVTNAGVNGATAREWAQEYFQNYNFAEYQVCLIEFGWNEKGAGGYTDTLETDVDPYDDYHDYANTHTAWYCRLIEMIKEQNPNILIVMVHTHGIIPVVGVLEKIAARYDIPIIDVLRGVDRYASKKGLLQGDGLHLTEGGNYLKAVSIYNALCPILANNIDKLFS